MLIHMHTLNIWMNYVVTSLWRHWNDGKPSLFPWPTGIQWCYMFSGPAESLYGPCRQPLWTWIRSHSPSWFQFCSDDTNSSMQCYHVSYVMIIYIYKWLLMCADISSDILCSRQKKHIQTSSHQFNMCSSIIRWRRVWRVAQGDRDPALQGVLAVKNSGDLFGGKLMEIVGNPVYLWRFWGNFWPICLVIRISVASSTVI